MTDDTITLPSLRPAAPVDEHLTGPPSWRRLMVWLAGWDKRREDWWDRLVLWLQPSTETYAGRHRHMAWMDERTGEYPTVVASGDAT